MKNNFVKQKRFCLGQSLIDLVFSIGIIVLVLVGVMTLMIDTTKIKKINLDRTKANQLAQKLIENEIKKMKQNPENFWTLSNREIPFNGIINNFSYRISYVCEINDKPDDKCDGTFTINWNNNQSLSVNRLFLKNGI